MSATVREYKPDDLEDMIKIWNEVVKSADAFPQTDFLSIKSAEDFFKNQSFTGVAQIDNEIAGLYILHPNNIGRCSHIANASYAVKSNARGKGIGETLVRHSLKKAKELDFKILQFNAVVKTNQAAIKLYKKLGFISLGTIPEGFQKADGKYEDIILFYHTL